MAPKQQKSKTPSPATADDIVPVNADYNLTRQGWITVIPNKLDDAILTAAPLTVAQGGYIDALDPKLLKRFRTRQALSPTASASLQVAT